MRILSRLWEMEGNRDKAEKYGKQAVEIFEPQPSSAAKALAFSNMAKLKLNSEEIIECIEWGNRAVAIATKIEDKNILCHILNTVGSAQWTAYPTEETGKNTLLKSLDIALKHQFHEHAARAYSSIVCNYITCNEYSLATQFLNTGIAYCEERGLD